MSIYCGLSLYNDDDINTLIQSNDINGIVIGDFFCQRKMFVKGEPQFYEALNMIGHSQKTLIYQTPVYITSRNRMQIMDNIKYINSVFPGSIILTQDIGVLKYIKDNCNTVEVAWSRMGRSRENSFNNLFYEVIQELGVSFIETESIDMADNMTECSIEPLFIYGNIHYKTIGRRCYCQYELDIQEEDCASYCRNSDYQLETLDGSYGMTIDGYMLDSKLKYNANILQKYKSNKAASLMVYATDLKNLQDKLLDL